MTTQILPNGIYQISSYEDSTLSITLKQQSNQYSLYFDSKNQYNENQFFYLKYQQEEECYSIISFTRTNSIGVEYSTSEAGSFVYENDLSFETNYLWNLLPYKQDQEKDNQEENELIFELQLKSSQILSQTIQKELDCLQKELQSQNEMIESYQSLQQTYTTLLNQFEQKTIDENIEIEPTIIQEEIELIQKEIEKRHQKHKELQKEINILETKIHSVKLGVSHLRRGLKDKDLMLKDEIDEKQLICRFIFEPVYVDSDDDSLQEWIENVEKVKEIAFKEEIEFPEDTTRLLKKPMSVYKKLQKITFPASLTEVEDKTFDHLVIKEVYCQPHQLKFFGERKDEIKKIIFTEETTQINEKVFKQMSYLNTLVIPIYVTSIEPNLLDGMIINTLHCNPIFLDRLGNFTALKYVISDDVETIDHKHFDSMNKTFEKIVIPKNVKNVHQDVFKSFTDITEITISNPEFVSSFSQKHLKKITIEPTENQDEKIITTEINPTVFEKCVNLKELHLPKTKQTKSKLVSLKRLKKLTCSTKLLSKFEKDEIKELQILDQMHLLDRSLTDLCVRLESLILPPNIVTVEMNFCELLTQLTRVKCDLNTLSQLSCKTLQAFELLETETEIDTGVFQLYPDLKELHIPTTVTHIGDFEFEKNSFETLECDPKWLHLFYHKSVSLKKLIIPESIVALKKKDLEECVSLTYLKIPRSVEEIENGTFEKMGNLRYHDCHPKWFNNFVIDIHKIEETEYEITRRMFYNCGTMKQVMIDADIDVIQESAFENCECLKEVVFKSTNKRLKEIRANAFKNCESLTSITFPSTITQLKLHPTAFDGCTNIQTYNCSNALKKQIEIVYAKELTISHEVKLISKDAYKGYVSIESLEIPMRTKIEFPEIFFEQFPLLNCLSCHPEYLQYLKHPEKIESFHIPDKLEILKRGMFSKLKSVEMIQIPLQVKYIEEGTFDGLDNLHTIKCRFEQLKYFNKKKLKTIIIHEKTFEQRYVEYFKECYELEAIILPDDFEKYHDKMFINSHKLKTIQYLSGKLENIRSQLIIPENKKQIERDEYKYIDNIDKLTIPPTVESIHIEAFEHMQYIEKYYGDPKWLEFIPSTKIKEISVPKEVEVIEGQHLNKCQNLEILSIFNPSIKFEHMYQLNNLKKIECSPIILLELRRYVESQIKHIILIHGTEVLPHELFNSFDELETIELPETITTVESDVFIDCLKLSIIKCPIQCLSYIPRKQINELVIQNSSHTELTTSDLIDFSQLEYLILPENIKTIPKNIFDLSLCPILKELSCSKHLLNETLKNHLKTIRFPYDEDMKPFINNLINIEGIKVKYEEKDSFDKTEILSKQQQDITVSELLPYNQTNKKYTDSVNQILQELNDAQMKKILEMETPKQLSKSSQRKSLRKSVNNSSSTYQVSIHKPVGLNSTSLQEITKCLSSLCIELKMNPNNIIEQVFKEKEWNPKPTQLLTVLRMADEILNPQSILSDKQKQAKGTIVELKIGEGKNEIMLMLSIILSHCYDRFVDIAFLDIETAINQMKQFKPIYELFFIQTDVLFNHRTERKIIKKHSIYGKISKSDVDKFNDNVLSSPVIFSTCENFEGIYLQSLMTNTPMRSPFKIQTKTNEDEEDEKNEKRKSHNKDIQFNRPYDILLLDEIDNMFKTQKNGMSSTTMDHDLLYSTDIFEMVYLSRHQSVQDIKMIVEYYLQNGISLTYEMVKKLKEVALQADTLKINRDYVIEKKKIKKVRKLENEKKVYEVSKQKGIAMIDKISGKVNKYDRFSNYLQEMIEVKEQLDITMNKNFTSIIPHNLFFKLYESIGGMTTNIGTPENEQILQNEYHMNFFKMLRNKPTQTIIYERERPIKDVYINEMISEEIKNENVSNKRPVIIIVDSPENVNQLSKLYQYSQSIKFIDNQTNEMIENMTKNEVITIITSSIFQRIEIPKSKESIHIIIPYWLQSERELQKTISTIDEFETMATVSIYTHSRDKSEKIQFNQTYQNLVMLQNEFSQYLIEKQPQVFERKNKEVFIEQYPFGMSWNETADLMKKLTLNRTVGFNDKKKFNTCVWELIMRSWSVFFTNVINNPLRYQDYHYVSQEYSLLITKFEDIPDYDKELMKAALKRTLLSEEIVYLVGFQIVGNIFKFILPGGLPGEIVRTSIGLIIRNGYEIARQRKSGKKIDYRKLFSVSLKELAIQSLYLFDVGGLVSAKIIGDAIKVFGSFVCEHILSQTIRTSIGVASDKMIAFATKSGLKKSIDKMFGGLNIISKFLLPGKTTPMQIARNELLNSQQKDTQYRKYFSLASGENKKPYEKQRSILSMIPNLFEMVAIEKSEEERLKEERRKQNENKSLNANQMVKKHLSLGSTEVYRNKLNSIALNKFIQHVSEKKQLVEGFSFFENNSVLTNDQDKMFNRLRELINSYQQSLKVRKEKEKEELYHKRKDLKVKLLMINEKREYTIQRSKEQGLTQKEIDFITSSMDLIIKQYIEELMIINIQLGKLPKLQKIVEELLFSEIEIDCFLNVMAIMGIGIVSPESVKLIESKRESNKEIIQHLENEKIKLRSIKEAPYIKEIEQLTFSEFGEVLFDSDFCNWDQNSSTFDSHIFGKEKVVFVIEDEDGNVFGCYINSMINQRIDNIVAKDNENSNFDNECILFSLNSNGRSKEPVSFNIQTKYAKEAFRLYSKYSEGLFTIGKQDVIIQKQKLRKYCNCQPTAFDYKRNILSDRLRTSVEESKLLIINQRILTGKVGVNQDFTVKRILAYQMIQTSEQSEEMRKKRIQNALTKEKESLQSSLGLLQSEYREPIEKIAHWTKLVPSHFIFDSNCCDWDENSSTFDKHIFNKENLAFIFTTSEDVVFGAFVDVPMDRYHSYDVRKEERNGIVCKNSILFSFKQGNDRIYQLHKVKQLNPTIFLFTQHDKQLIMFGNEDLCIMKKCYKSYCMQNEESYYNYEGNDKALSNHSGNESSERFELKRMVVVEFE